MAEENETERDDEETRDDEASDAEDGDEAESSSESGSSDSSDSKDEAPAGADDLARREAAEAEAAAREAAEAEDHPAAASIASLLGVERWVQFAFIAGGVVLFFLVDNLVRFGWGQFGEPDPSVVSAVAAVSAVLGAYALYRHPQVNQLSTEVVTELRDVTWPSRDEVYYSTIVVIVTSVVAAVYTGLFDAFWSFLTNQVYGG